MARVAFAATALVVAGVGATLPGFAVTTAAVNLPVASALPDLPVPTLSPALPSPTSILPTPSALLPSPSPSPSLPVSAGSPAPSPLAATPNPSSAPNVAGGGPRTTSGGGSAPGGGPPRGIAIPLTSIVVRGPLNVALVVSVAVLPLLFGLWLLLFARTWTRARLAKDARLRLALATDLGLTPSQLESLSTQALFKLRDRAAFDELTGVLRRAAGIAATDREIARARRESRPLAVAFVDVDGLKQTNDRRGHRAGDDLLRNLAGALRSGLRGQDLIFRYGGDEFVCVLPDTDEDAAREKIAEIQANASEQLAVRFCAGVTQMRKGDDVVNLLARADRQLYSLKAARGADGDASPQPQTPRPGRPIVV